MYKKGDYVLCNFNTCQIKDIVTIKDNDYYVLNPVSDTSLTIKVPVKTGSELLSDIIKKEDALKLIKEIPQIEIIDCKDHALENEYKKLMTTKDRKDLVRIIKTTYLRNKNREANGKRKGEKDSTYFNLAEKTLYNELSISLNIPLEEVKNFIAETINNQK